MEKRLFVTILSTMMEMADGTTCKYITEEGDKEYILCSNGKSVDITGDSLIGIMMDFSRQYFGLQDKSYEAIPYVRLVEICEYFRDGLLEDGKEEAMKYFKAELTKEEMEALEIEDEKRYKIVKVELSRRQTAWVNVAIPEDADVRDAMEYIVDENMIEEEETEDWDIEDTEVNEVKTENEIDRHYDEGSLWNYFDYKDN